MFGFHNTVPYLHKEYERAGRRGVWHFTPADWLIVSESVTGRPTTHKHSDKLFGLDTTVSDTFTSPPRLVNGPG